MAKKLFIVFEGIDGSGKTTQAEKLYLNLERRLNEKCYLTKEPTNGPIGSLIKDEYLSGNKEISREGLIHLFMADRLEHLHTGKKPIEKMLDEKIVICDRYVLSTLAYNDVVDEDINLKELVKNQIKIVPDVTFFIDVSIETSLERVEKRKGLKEIFDNVKDKERIIGRYKNIIKEYPGHNIHIIDGEEDEETISEQIFSTVSKLLEYKE